MVLASYASKARAYQVFGDEFIISYCEMKAPRAPHIVFCVFRSARLCKRDNNSEN